MINENVNRPNNSYLSSENPHAIHVVPLHDLQVKVWCAASVCKL